jgi:hypothetical protein
MKSIVFGDGLLCMAFAGPGKIQHGALDRLPLLVQTEAVIPRATTVPAVLPICRPRQSDVDLRAAKTRVTSPLRTEAGPQAGCQAATTTGVSCRRHRAKNFKAPIQRTHPYSTNRAFILTTTLSRHKPTHFIDTRLNLLREIPAVMSRHCGPLRFLVLPVSRDSDHLCSNFLIGVDFCVYSMLERA